jgi:hypothetical protein
MGSEYTVFSISNMHKVDVSVSPQRIDHRIQGVADNAVTPFTPALTSISYKISATFGAITISVSFYEIKQADLAALR